MALYEEKYGKEDFKIASYYKKDYVSYQTIFTVIWVTIGYVVLFGVFAAAFVETFLSNGKSVRDCSVCTCGRCAYI